MLWSLIEAGACGICSTGTCRATALATVILHIACVHLQAVGEQQALDAKG